MPVTWNGFNVKWWFNRRINVKFGFTVKFCAVVKCLTELRLDAENAAPPRRFSFGFTVVNAIPMRYPSDTNSPRIDRTLSELYVAVYRWTPVPLENLRTSAAFGGIHDLGLGREARSFGSLFVG
jgi:hypothetical protein